MSTRITQAQFIKDAIGPRISEISEINGKPNREIVRAVRTHPKYFAPMLIAYADRTYEGKPPANIKKILDLCSEAQRETMASQRRSIERRGF